MDQQETDPLRNRYPASGTSGRKFVGMFAMAILLGWCTSCSDDTVAPQEPPSGTLSLQVNHLVDGNAPLLNQVIYTNAAGNPYSVTDVMYFISDIDLYGRDGHISRIKAWKDIFYLDIKMPATLSVQFPDRIPAGEYDSLAFTFGLSPEKNISYTFVNPPEAIMAWPEVLGGGYHYMMINGWWRDMQGALQPYNFHLGIGQLYKGTGYNTDSIYAFVHNNFRVTLPGSAFTVTDGGNTALNLTMHIDRWFRDPHTWDHNHWGGAIMQNQAAMQEGKENGWNVFTMAQP